MSTSHVRLPGSYRPAPASADRLRDADQDAHVEVTLTLRGPQLPDADHLPDERLTPEDLARLYSASPEDAAAVRRVLEEFGLKVEEESLQTRSMRVSGTVGQMEAAFQPNLGIYESHIQVPFRGREGHINIPAPLAGKVTGVFGLDERRVAHRSTTGATTPSGSVPQLPPLTPAELEAGYTFPPGDGAGQTIAIAEFGGGYFERDLLSFCYQNKRSVPDVRTVSVNIAPLTVEEIQNLPSPEKERQIFISQEVMMDVEIVAGLCPAAKIFVYFASFDQKGWVDLLNKVITGDPALPVCLSISYSSPEDGPDWSEQAICEINDRLNAAAQLGITVCASSGDDGSMGDTRMTDGNVHVNFPSSSPFVLSVGGTMLTSTPQGVTETVFWVSPGRRDGRGGGATGGGVSILFPRPGWQDVRVDSLNTKTIASTGNKDGRVIPDVAALAGLPGYALTIFGQNVRDGGTSASTPLWAALIARINACFPTDLQQRFLTRLLYEYLSSTSTRGAAGCQVMTNGFNTSCPDPCIGYHACEGYDAVSGWGTPDGKALLVALAH